MPVLGNKQTLALATLATSNVQRIKSERMNIPDEGAEITTKFYEECYMDQPKEGVTDYAGACGVFCENASVGSSKVFVVVGLKVGEGHPNVWGSSPYWWRSYVDEAAHHHGLLSPGEEGCLTVTCVAPPVDGFNGSSAFGSTSRELPIGGIYGHDDDVPLIMAGGAYTLSRVECTPPLLTQEPEPTTAVVPLSSGMTFETTTKPYMPVSRSLNTTARGNLAPICSDRGASAAGIRPSTTIEGTWLLMLCSFGLMVVVGLRRRHHNLAAADSVEVGNDDVRSTWDVSDSLSCEGGRCENRDRDGDGQDED